MALQTEMWAPPVFDKTVAELLLKWFSSTAQPCMFGRAAATRHQSITFCILHEDELLASDEYIRKKIQSERKIWRIQAARGVSSAFFLFATSERLAKARPDQNLMMLGCRLLQMWLELPEPPENLVDWPHHELVWLDDESAPGEGLEWHVETNYFGAQGDQRWWHDHRVPGGIGFTANSVGHLIESHKKAERAQRRKGSRLGAGLAESPLLLAMKTILQAFPHPKSGRATNLFELKPDAYARLASSFASCPVPEFRANDPLAFKDYSRYGGWFHTNHAIPAIFFQPDITRPVDATRFDDIDFTYLFHADPENQDYWRMTKGLPRRRQRND